MSPPFFKFAENLLVELEHSQSALITPLSYDLRH